MTLEEVRRAIAFEQPKLSATQDGSIILIEGEYVLVEKTGSAAPEGPISSFEIKIVTSRRYPVQEPAVFEIAGRIPRTAERHINADGDCCVTVWEEWLTNSDDTSFAAFLAGPLYEFFLGQYWFEKTGKWPFGERSHGEKGLVEAYADVLGIPPQKKDVLYYLRILSKDWPKGHWPCPCGSGKRIRHCHRAEVKVLHERVPPRLAKRMLRRLRSQSPTI
ncbi:hypothetical protein [Nitratireductor sp. XY-223]|uniref:hypothetical protein n=1 Tax=Nitratireductor sp. XY-223 TaxID=2561926 RepID=UPI0010AACBFC|nr:hypothetical protein [Nitratireductor sp. XY-223]